MPRSSQSRRWSVRTGIPPELLARDYVTGSGVGKQGACHLFRRTMASLMLEGGADLRYSHAMLGHAELSRIQIYTNSQELHQAGEKPQVA